jgi:hypothetical protein
VIDPAFPEGNDVVKLIHLAYHPYFSALHAERIMAT